MYIRFSMSFGWKDSCKTKSYPIYLQPVASCLRHCVDVVLIMFVCVPKARHFMLSALKSVYGCCRSKFGSVRVFNIVPGLDVIANEHNPLAFVCLPDNNRIHYDGSVLDY